MVRALFLAAGWAIMGIFSNQKIVATTLPTTGFRDFILWDGHVTTFGSGGTWPCFAVSPGTATGGALATFGGS